MQEIKANPPTSRQPPLTTHHTPLTTFAGRLFFSASTSRSSFLAETAESYS
jgi:hypothetical protein